MTGILGMNLNLIELLTILQLTTIRNGSDDKNIKLQSIIGLVKFLKIRFLYSTLETSPHNFVFRPSSALKLVHCGPWPKKGCAPLF